MSRISTAGIEWNVETRGSKNGQPLILLHGFAGSLHAWDRIAPFLEPHFRLILLDLPGHGETPLPPEEIGFAEFTNGLIELIQKIARKKPILCGYSMGGRLALHAGVEASETLRGLILIGASPGIEEPRERAKRRNADHDLAADILTKGLEWFADHWGSLPLFASQKDLPIEIQNDLRRARLANDPNGLAYSLAHWGAGEQEFVGPYLYKIRCPLLLLAGALDQKFCLSNHYMASAVGTSNLRRVEIPHAGHAAHIEQPEAVAQEIITFAQTLQE